MYESSVSCDTNAILDELICPLPLDCHVHLRDGNALQDTASCAARSFAAIVVMPNLVPPVLSVTDALQYKSRIDRFSSDKMQAFFALYLTDATTYVVIHGSVK